jgi:predicted MFS family arabinose efflux permease
VSPTRSASLPADAKPYERRLLAVVVLVQFINILDFMMISPLGPTLAGPLGISPSELGDPVAAYTFAAAFAGLGGSFFLDRFDRRTVLVICVAALGLGTCLGALATSRIDLVAARMVAGFFGGPATSVAIAMVADTIPAYRRGKALGIVMGSFAAATVLGVPLSLMLAEVGGWQAPFLGIGLAAISLAGVARGLLPTMREHLNMPHGASISLGQMLGRPAVRASYLMTFTMNVGGFALIPNISTFVQNNLSVSLSALKYLYLAGGIVSFFTTRAAGRLVDKVGSFRVGLLGCLLQVSVVYSTFVAVGVMPFATHLIPTLYVFFIGFMFANGIRNVACSTLATQVPRPAERARFTSLQSCVQHFGAAIGASTSARILESAPDGSLTHLDRVAWITIVSSLLLPMIMLQIEKRRTREGLQYGEVLPVRSP